MNLLCFNKGIRLFRKTVAMLLVLCVVFPLASGFSARNFWLSLSARNFEQHIRALAPELLDDIPSWARDIEFNESDIIALGEILAPMINDDAELFLGRLDTAFGRVVEATTGAASVRVPTYGIRDRHVSAHPLLSTRHSGFILSAYTQDTTDVMAMRQADMPPLAQPSHERVAVNVESLDPGALSGTVTYTYVDRPLIPAPLTQDEIDEINRQRLHAWEQMMVQVEYYRVSADGRDYRTRGSGASTYKSLSSTFGRNSRYYKPTKPTAIVARSSK